MTAKKSLLSIIAITLCFCLLNVLQVSAAEYTYTMERFEASGNNAGIPGIIEEFNGGTIINPPWEIYDPTVEEAGGAVNFKNPGSHDHFQLGNLDITSEMSYLHYSLMLEEGNGGFTATTAWSSGVPGINQFFTMNTSEADGGEEFVIGFSNFSSEVADFFEIPQGPSVFFGRVSDITSIISGDYEIEGFAVDPEEITSDILLQLIFSDSEDTFTASYSLDGGSTYLDPFSSISVGSAGLDVKGITMGGETWDVRVVPVPSSVFIMFSGLIGLAGAGRKNNI